MKRSVRVRRRTVGSIHKNNKFLKLQPKLKWQTLTIKFTCKQFFAVKYRNAVINKTWRSLLCGVVGNLINEANCKTIIVNGVEDHIHCFIGLKPVVSVSELMKTVKAKSSKYINDHSLTSARFEWQEGYGVFSYQQNDVDTIYKYVQNQEEHHKMQTFREEYLDLLKEFKVEYDEQYIFQDMI